MNKNIVKTDFENYMKFTLGVSNSSIIHYLQAMRAIDKFLLAKGIIQDSVYCILDSCEIENIKKILFVTGEFAEKDVRGKRMYSAAFNKYLRFADEYRNKYISKEINVSYQHHNFEVGFDSCDMLHAYTNSLKRYYSNFDSSKLPMNGVIYCFEKGEKINKFDRIVYVDSSNEIINLQSVFKQYLGFEDSFNNALRINIGSAILNMNNKIYGLSDWVDKREKEKSISNHIREYLSFSVIPLEDISDCITLKQMSYGLIKADTNIKPSDNWLGRFSPCDKIASSGIWFNN